MEITEVRVKLVSNKDDRLKAFCSITMDNEFVVRDIKIIEGSGGYFVAMPSRKMSDHCEKCGGVRPECSWRPEQQYGHRWQHRNQEPGQY